VLQLFSYKEFKGLIFVLYIILLELEAPNNYIITVFRDL